MPLCPAEPHGQAARGNLHLLTWGRRSLFCFSSSSKSSGPGDQSQHVMMSWVSPGFLGWVQCLRNPFVGPPSSEGPELFVAASVASAHGLLCPWLLSDLFLTTISYFPMSPPDPSPSSAHCCEPLPKESGFGASRRNQGLAGAGEGGMTDAAPCHGQASVPSQLQPCDVGTVCGFCPFKGRTWLGQTDFLIPAVLTLCAHSPGLQSWVEVAELCLWSPGPTCRKAAFPFCPVPLPACSNNQALHEHETPAFSCMPPGCLRGPGLSEGESLLGGCCRHSAHRGQAAPASTAGSSSVAQREAPREMQPRLSWLQLVL